jgi:hypothetical protein
LSTNLGQNWTAIFVNDKGNGQKSFPVCYFPPGYNVTAENLGVFLSTQMTVFLYGCIPGEMVFSDGSDALTLYVTNSYGTLSEMSFLAGGQIAPIAYVDLLTNGVMVNDIVGSFPITILNWSPITDLSIVYIYDDENIGIFGEETTALIVTNAYDLDRYVYDNITKTLNGSDIYIYEYSVQGSSSDSPVSVETTRPVALTPVAPTPAAPAPAAPTPVATIPISGPVSTPAESPVGGSNPVPGTPTIPTNDESQKPPTNNGNGTSAPVGSTSNGFLTGLSRQFKLDYIAMCSVIALLAGWYLV